MADTNGKDKQRGDDEDDEKKKPQQRQGGDDDGDDDDDEDDPVALRKARDKWKQEARKWESRSKANADKAKKYDELENKNKTDSERLVELERKDKEKERELLRARIALRKGLTEQQAKRLIGETEDDMEADADELLESFRTADDDGGKGVQRKRPTEKFTSKDTRQFAQRSGAQGQDKEPLPSREDVSKIVDEAMSRS